METYLLILHCHLQLLEMSRKAAHCNFFIAISVLDINLLVTLHVYHIAFTIYRMIYEKTKKRTV